MTGGNQMCEYVFALLLMKTDIFQVEGTLFLCYLTKRGTHFM